MFKIAKKVLLCLCFCGIIIGSFAGCEMITGEQNSGNINIENGTVLNKEDAFSILLMAENNANNAALKNVKLVLNTKSYSGFKDKLENESTITEFIKIIDSNNKYSATLFNDQISKILKSKFNTDVQKEVHYMWTPTEGFQTREYKTQDFLLNYSLNLFEEKVFNASNIVTATKTKDAYILTVALYIEEEDKPTSSITITHKQTQQLNITINKDLTYNHIHITSVDNAEESQNYTTEVSTTEMDLNYFYQDIDYSVIDSKIEEIESLNLK